MSVNPITSFNVTEDNNYPQQLTRERANRCAFVKRIINRLFNAFSWSSQKKEKEETANEKAVKIYSDLKRLHPGLIPDLKSIVEGYIIDIEKPTLDGILGLIVLHDIDKTNLNLKKRIFAIRRKLLGLNNIPAKMESSHSFIYNLHHIYLIYAVQNKEEDSVKTLMDLGAMPDYKVVGKSAQFTVPKTVRIIEMLYGYTLGNVPRDIIDMEENMNHMKICKPLLFNLYALVSDSKNNMFEKYYGFDLKKD